MSRGRKPRSNKGPNTLLRQERERRGWSQSRLAEEIGATSDMVSRWERGERGVDYIYQEKLCNLFGKNTVELGILEEGQAEQSPTRASIPTGSSSFSPSGATSSQIDNPSALDLGVREKLDSAESIIDLAWEAWFASRPREVARAVNKLLPGLERIAHSSVLPIYTLRAKE